MRRSNSKRYLITQVGSQGALTESTIRCSLAEQVGLTPFQVVVGLMAESEAGRIYEARVVSAERLDEPVSRFPWSVVRVPESMSVGELHRLATYGVTACARIAGGMGCETPKTLLLGRPIVLSAALGAGQCRLSRYTYQDWDVYRFSRPGDRRRSFETFLFGQQWLSKTCEHYSVRVASQPGCSVSLGVGRAINS